MTCYSPLDAYQLALPNAEGKRPIIFSTNKAKDHRPIKLACGQCIGCRLEKSRQWAARCMHEAQLYEDNCFITLTFNTEELEKRKNPWSVDVKDFQLFMKRLRKKYNGQTIRYYHCGEYGELSNRPHYHACLFNFNFPDRELYKYTSQGHALYTSNVLSELWPYGFSTIGELTFESAAYTARYVMKKITGKNAEDHYIDQDGVIIKPEYTTMSRRPGIGMNWIKKYKDDVYPSDVVVVNGTKVKPPRYYDNKLRDYDPVAFDEIKLERFENAIKHVDNNTYDRLKVREHIQNVRLKQLPRNVD